MPDDTHTLHAFTGGNEAAAIIEVAQEAAKFDVVDIDVDGKTLKAVVDRDGKLLVTDLEKYKGRPDRTIGVYRPATVKSFMAYVDTHQVSDETTIWVHPTSGQIEAIFDDNSAADNGWGSHRAVLNLVPTEEWKFWLSNDGRFLPQQAFAEHLQDGLIDISSPDGAELLEIAQSIQATTSAKFRQAVQLSNGEVKMVYDEDIEGKAGKAGNLEIPQEFELYLSPFVGSNPEFVKARFRYRIKDGELSLGYKLEQPDRLIRTVLDRIADGLEAKYSRVYSGTSA